MFSGVVIQEALNKHVEIHSNYKIPTTQWEPIMCHAWYLPLKSFHLILNEIEGLLRVLSRGVCVLVTQSCPTLCNPKNCSPPGSSVHGILQARMLEWVAIPFSKQRGNMLQTEPLMLLADCGPFSPKQGKNKWSLGASCEGGEAPHSPGQGPAGQ